MKQYLPRGLRRRLSLWRRRLQGTPESTFMRVAYASPRQVVLITVRHERAENIWPIDFHVPLSFQPPLYGIAVNRNGYGTELVRKSGVFVVNFVPATWETVIFLCGNVSGRTVDKFARTGLRKEEAESVDAPRLAEALGVLECRVQETIEVGDHTLFIGAVMREIRRANAPRLHHLDVGLKDVTADFERRPADDPSAADEACRSPRPGE